MTQMLPCPLGGAPAAPRARKGRKREKMTDCLTRAGSRLNDAQMTGDVIGCAVSRDLIGWVGARDLIGCAVARDLIGCAVAHVLIGCAVQQPLGLGCTVLESPPEGGFSLEFILRSFRVSATGVVSLQV